MHYNKQRDLTIFSGITWMKRVETDGGWEEKVNWEGHQEMWKHLF